VSSSPDGAVAAGLCGDPSAAVVTLDGGADFKAKPDSKSVRKYCFRGSAGAVALPASAGSGDAMGAETLSAAGGDVGGWNGESAGDEAPVALRAPRLLSPSTPAPTPAPPPVP
jgi:hypothetical protein